MEKTFASDSPQGIRFLLGILLVTSLCAIIWTGIVKRFNLSAALAESGGQTNLIRLSNLLNGEESSAVFVGSSLTGRLMPAYFPPGTMRNFAIEGGGSIDGINLLLALKKIPPVLFVEENSITREVNSTNSFLSDSATSLQMKMSRHLHLLRPEFRPSSVAYSWLKSKIDNRRAAPDRANESESALARQQINGTHSDTEKNRRIFFGLVKLLHSQGTEIFVFKIPDGVGAFPPVQLPEAGEYLLRTDLPEKYLSRFGAARYSDGLHLLAPDARQFAELLQSSFPSSFLSSHPQPEKK